MRSYPINSPRAAARIIALTLVADGDIGDAEVRWLDQFAVHTELGLERKALHEVLDTFCEDLLSSGQLQCADACPVDERTLSNLMSEIENPSLRLKLMHLCIALAEADADVAEGESIVLNAAVEHWGLHREMLRPPPPH
jgi:uncharacterized tellurite resistance protein B-like protein